MNKILLHVFWVIFMTLLAYSTFAGNLRIDLALNAILPVGAAEPLRLLAIPVPVIPEIDMYYVFNTGILNFGMGIRSLFVLVEMVCWPNIFMELELGPFSIGTQLGGGFIAGIGIMPMALYSGPYCQDKFLKK